jgi:hypothetical protein
LPKWSCTVETPTPPTLPKPNIHRHDATAESVRDELKELANLYDESLGVEMETATRLCRETPLESLTRNPNARPITAPNDTDTDTDDANTGNQRIDYSGVENTPCGRLLQLASLRFLETTHATKPQVVMASRAHLILALAMEFHQPLGEICKSGSKEKNLHIRNTFQQNVVSVPWLRSDEEYEELLKIKSEMI